MVTHYLFTSTRSKISSRLAISHVQSIHQCNYIVRAYTFLASFTSTSLSKCYHYHYLILILILILIPKQFIIISSQHPVSYHSSPILTAGWGQERVAKLVLVLALVVVVVVVISVLELFGGHDRYYCATTFVSIPISLNTVKHSPSHY